MLSRWVIAGVVGFDGLFRLVLTVVAPIRDPWVRITISVVYLLAATAGFLVIRWDERQEARSGCDHCAFGGSVEDVRSRRVPSAASDE